jgi:protein-S-isoprenylcysteine O-methyltransferase Ste14
MPRAEFVDQAVVFLWLPIFLIWAITGRAVKETVRSESEGRSRVSVGFVWFAWLLLFSHGFRRPPLSLKFMMVTTATVAVGLALTAVGLAFSTWARFSIGRNWSRMIEVKQNHKLIRKGPYAIVRHPIYSGFMLATLGTAVAFAEWSGLVAFVLLTVSWAYKARLEETAMIAQFGMEYERYRREVKGLVPFLW